MTQEAKTLPNNYMRTVIKMQENHQQKTGWEGLNEILSMATDGLSRDTQAAAAIVKEEEGYVPRVISDDWIALSAV